MFTKFLIDKMDRKMNYHQVQQHLHNNLQTKATQQQQQERKLKMVVADPTTPAVTKNDELKPQPSKVCATTTTTTKTTKFVSGGAIKYSSLTIQTRATQSAAKTKHFPAEQPLDALVSPKSPTATPRIPPATTNRVHFQLAADAGETRGQLPSSARPASCTASAMGMPPTSARPPVSLSNLVVKAQRPAYELPDEMLRSSRRNNLRDLSMVQNQNQVQVQDKNLEALRELHERIPEITKIFDVHCRIGSGTFSTVLLGTLQRERRLTESQRRRFAIKHHNATSHPERILRELECMFKVGGVNNVIGINCCIRFNDNVAFVMPYMNHDRFHDIYRTLSVAEVRDYMHKLLVALRHVHKFNIIHRDVKPSNILFNRRTRQFLLCDFGLAQQVSKDGTIMQYSERNSMSLMRSMETARQQMLTCSAADGTTCQDEAEACRTLAKNEENMQSMRALGGGGGVEHRLTATAYRAPGFEQRHSTRDLALLSKQDLANQKADTVRLLNHLRFVNSNIDPNHYVVSTNTTRKDMHASRAGTPGYRPPEVLMRYQLQTTAVDIWAAGVILLSLLSSMHPFFKAPNDCSALSEIINVFGDLSIRKTAFLMDRLVLLTQKANALDLRRVCMRLRYADYFLAPDMLRRYQRADGTFEMCRNCAQPGFNCLCKHSSHHLEQYDGVDIFPFTVYDLLTRLLEVDPHKRITADEALKHPFFCDQQRILAGVPTHQLVPSSQQSRVEHTSTHAQTLPG